MTFEYVSRVPPEGGGEQEMLCVSGASITIDAEPVPDGLPVVFSVWCVADAAAQIDVYVGEAHSAESVGTSWARIIVKASASGTITITAPSSTDIYLYKAQLEVGTRETDWKPAQEDTESDIQTARDIAERNRQTLNAYQQIVQFKRDGLYIYPATIGDDGQTIVDETGYYNHIQNASYSIQHSAEAHPTWRIEPGRTINGKTITYTTADGSTAERAIRVDDYD